MSPSTRSFQSAWRLNTASLATFGVYGVIAFMVATRTREIDIRVVLGASRGRVLRDVLAGALTLVVSANDRLRLQLGLSQRRWPPALERPAKPSAPSQADGVDCPLRSESYQPTLPD